MKLRVFPVLFFVLLCLTTGVCAASAPTVIYKMHVQDIGWMKEVANGNTAGTTGKAKHAEAYTLEGVLSKDSHLRYCSHVQDYGWLDWVQDGEVSGTEGENKQMEAIAIELTGPDAKAYDIYYRVHVSDVGWLGWTKNGENAGSQGLNKAIEAMEVVTVEKDAEAPGSTLRPFLTKGMEPIAEAAAHISDVGWVESPLFNTLIGTTGQNHQLEALQLQYLDETNAKIEYTSHLADLGWEKSWHADGEISGTTGQARDIQAVKIRLTGEGANKYDIYYQAHCQNVGWLDWAKNGEPAGTTKANLGLEALNIVLVEKGGDPPGRTDEPCRTPLNPEHFKQRIKGCWIDLVRADEPLKSYVTGIADSYLFMGQNSTYNGTEGYYEILTSNTTGGRIRFVDAFTKETKEAYLDFKDLPADEIIIRLDGNERHMKRGDTTDGIHYTFSGLMQYGQLAVVELKDKP